MRGAAPTPSSPTFNSRQYDPARNKVTKRPIHLDGNRWTPAGNSSIPTWQVAEDGRTAYLILMDDPIFWRSAFSTRARW